ncbi:caspase family protein [Candidatus Oscillochloris fontis]|uniref:caspase family protein n=1 Tax=Candidatus Oscillochloris fontis TaxID=2496868 RepID=UPI001375F63F|nr:caspase family protein [Candidatus Oscillochloris fontis]
MPFSTAHALVIGVGTYAHVPRFNVPITATDATSVATVLRDPQLCGYPSEQVALLSNTDASRAGILAALDGLTRVNADDTVFIFYAGHGEYGDDGYYLTTHDTRMDGKKVVVGTGVREAELIAKLRAIPAKRLVLIVNACHAGEISPVLAAGDAPPTGNPMPPPVAAALLGTGEGRVIISACRENQYAFIGPGPLTLFTQALVDGLQGKGIVSNHGYISIFDLYTHLYFTLEESVTRQISVATRKHYGEKQEPELTILKGVGPFAVALYRGASTLGTFDASSSPPEDTAVREVNPAYSQVVLRQRQHQQRISGNAQVGAAIAGDVHGNVNVDQRRQQGGVHFGDGGQYGDISIGDVVGGDTITTGDIRGTGIAIGPGAQSSVRRVETGGGDYAEGSIDKRRGTFVSGDQFTMSGNFSGALLNIKSTLSNVTQSIAAAPHADAAAKAQLQTLLDQLSTELQRVPATHAAAAEQTAKRIEQTVAEATKPRPDREDVAYSLKRLQQAAEQIALVLPTVLPITIQISEVVRRMIGG